MKLQLKLVTPITTVFEQEVDGVSLPTQMGQITVLPNHTEIVSVLTAGELIVRNDDKQFPLAVSGGLVEVNKNTLYVLADSAEHAQDIDITAAESRTQQLEQDLKERTDLDLNTYTLLQRQLEAERAKLHVAKKWHK
ncbi:MAG: ATP synthase F1 subunit epsilon [Patescibacteria group bacterium]